MNNKTNSLITIILGVAVIMLFILHFTKSGEASPAKAEVNDEHQETPIANSNNDGPKSINGLKIAYVNTDTVTKYYEYNKKLTEELMAKQASAENKIRKEAEKLQADAIKFQQEAPIMGQEELERRGAELQRRDQELAMMEQDLGNKLADKGYKANYDYVVTTDSYMQKIGKELGYDYIIGYRMGDLIMFANPEYDITRQVIDMLNKEYNAKSKTE